jgi:uncharacterized protein YuzE
MKVTVGNLTFDHTSYGKEGDVLYLHVGEPTAAAESDETPEGHVVRFDEGGAVIGLTIINAKWLINRDGGVLVTLPDLKKIDAKDLKPALAG